METVSRLDVYCGGKHVGTIAPWRRYQTAFEYSPGWLRDGFSISPFSLPLEPGVKTAPAFPFEGLFGVFADSLPDGWGRLLVDRMLRKHGERPEEVSAFSRLSIVGDSGMGALEYRPVFQGLTESRIHDLDRLSSECQKILLDEDSDDLDALFALGGSSGGARPKVLLKIDGEDWIVKFPSSGDSKDIGLMEYEYNICARECGIDIPEVRLFPSKTGPGFFGSRRFDRRTEQGTQQKIHMVTASALLEISHRVPALDYLSLMSLTWQLTKETADMQKMFRLMCFNVFAHNRDDHSHNFSYLCDNGIWRLAPAYDLTYSNSMGGEHATTVSGEGRNPEMSDILKVAAKAGIRERTARESAEQIRETVEKRLAKYLTSVNCG